MKSMFYFTEKIIFHPPVNNIKIPKQYLMDAPIKLLALKVGRSHSGEAAFTSLCLRLENVPRVYQCPFTLFFLHDLNDDGMKPF